MEVKIKALEEGGSETKNSEHEKELESM